MAPAWTPAAPPEASIRVFYATDRKPIAPEDKPCPGASRLFTKVNFSHARSEPGTLSFGEFQVRIPPDHHVGSSLTKDGLPRCWNGDAHPVFGSGPSQLSQPEWVAAVRSAMTANGNQGLLLYLHGTRFRFDESATWAAQFGYDVQFPGPVIVFSWPSGEGRWDYMEGEGNTEWSRPHLTALLRDLSHEFPGARIHIVAHSLGARILMHSLDELGREVGTANHPKFGQVVLAAADVDSEIFRRLLPNARAMSQRMSAYVAADDKALGASAKVHGYPRTGRDLASVEGVDIIEASRTDGSDYNHNYFTQNRRVLFDLFQLLRDSTPPDRRFGLVRMENGGHTYWQLRP